MPKYTDDLNRVLHKPWLIEFKRSCCPREKETGFLVDFHRDLLLLQSFDWNPFRCHGWTILRHDDVKSYRTWEEPADWPNPALKRLRIKPAAVPPLDLRTIAGAIRSAAKCAPLFTVYREKKYPDECWIGRKPRCRTGKLTFETISPMAEWDGDYTIELADITKIVIGDGYAAALALTAGN